MLGHRGLGVSRADLLLALSHRAGDARKRGGKGNTGKARGHGQQLKGRGRGRGGDEAALDSALADARAARARDAGENQMKQGLARIVAFAVMLAAVVGYKQYTSAGVAGGAGARAKAPSPPYTAPPTQPGVLVETVPIPVRGVGLVDATNSPPFKRPAFLSLLVLPRPFPRPHPASRPWIRARGLWFVVGAATTSKHTLIAVGRVSIHLRVSRGTGQAARPRAQLDAVRRRQRKPRARAGIAYARPPLLYS